MDAGEARHLKHELRTPINHIIGYSALLVEAAQDNGDTAFAAQATDIQSIADELRRTVEKVLVGSRDSLDQANIWGMRESVIPLIARISMKLQPTAGSYGIESYEEDLHRIRGATERLQTLLANVASPGRLDLSACN